MYMKAIIPFVLLVLFGFSQLALGKPIMSDINQQAIINTFMWFNRISSEQRTTFSENDIAKFFDKDAQMITNGKLVCQGIKEHFDHFVELNDHYKFLHADVSKMDIQKSGNRFYLHYLIQGKDNEGNTVIVHVMGYMVLKNQKIVLFNEVISKQIVTV